MTKYIGSIDQGTTTTRFIVFDSSGKIIAVDQKEHRQFFPKPGWVEHDPNEIFKTRLPSSVMRFANPSLSLTDLAAFGITNQRETSYFGIGTLGSRSEMPSFGRIPARIRFARNYPATEVLIATGRKPVFPWLPIFLVPKITWAIDNDPEIQTALKSRWQIVIWKCRFLVDLEFNRWKSRRNTCNRCYQCFSHLCYGLVEFELG